MLENFNINPYYDDYNDEKNFHRMLFKPSFAVQARELTQVQTILQKQVERFGNHIFKNGSVVTGGQFFFQNCVSLKINDEYSSFNVNIFNFENKTIYSLDRTKRAEVIKVYDNDLGTGDPKTILCKQLYGERFDNNEVLVTEDGFFCQIQSDGAFRNGLLFSINEGVFYINGFFVKCAKQTIAVSKYTPLGSGKVGFEINESIVTPSSDTSLLDPALGSSNYQAPGSDRYKIELILSQKDLNSTDLEKFVELARIENGTLLDSIENSVYSVLEDTFARRTYDESGNYTVKPFQISLQTNESNTAQTDIIVSPGKAYVFGYEYETKSPTIITVDKPRTKESVQNEIISADYGSFVYTKDQFNSFPIDTLKTVDIHCVNVESINTSSTLTISNTKIGTARVKALEFDNALNTSNTSTYTFRTYLFDIKTNNLITGNVISSGSNTTHIKISTSDSPYTTVNNAYIGAKFKITNGVGSNESVKIISGFNASNQTIVITEPFIETPNDNSTFSINFEFDNSESLVVFNGNQLLSASNIDNRSKNFALPYNDTILGDINLTPLIFNLGKKYISDDVSDLIYYYRRLYNKTFGSTSSGILELNTGEQLSSATTDFEKIRSYQIYVVNNRNSAPYANGSIVPASAITSIDTTLNQISVLNANNMIANIVATIIVPESNPKNKSFIGAHSEIEISGGESILSGNVIIHANSILNQTTIKGSEIVKVPDVPQSLYVSDVIRLVSVYDFRGNPISNLSLDYVDITNRYVLDNGQRDSFYDHASIKIKPGFEPPIGPIVVRYERYESPDEGGYFNVDSYPNYNDIPIFVSQSNGKEYYLRDSIDFRPVRKNASSLIGTNVEFKNGSSFNNPKIVQVGSDIILDYSHYLGRIDKLILNKNRTFEVVKGIPSINPKEPKDKNNSMLLYILENQPYVTNTNEISVKYIDNKRYTMRDIGNIDKRVQNLEYYTSLSLLEQDTLNKVDLSILDTENLSRFKNGIIVDGFGSHSVADVFSEDYRASIDIKNRNLRPAFNIGSYDLDYNSNNSINTLQTGPLITISGDTVEYIRQNVASKAVNLNPFQVTRFVGQVTLTPSSDIWVDTFRRPEVLVNIGGNQDAWDLLIDRAGLTNWSTEYGSWETRWTGQPSTTLSQFWQGDSIVERSTTTEQVGETRTGISTRAVAETITQSIGDRIIDVSVIPFMRIRHLRFVGRDFKPNTTLYAFFDSKPVSQYSHRFAQFYLDTNNLNYIEGETLLIVNDNTGNSNANVVYISTSNNIVYGTLPRTDGTLLPSANLSLVGSQSGESHKILVRNHYAGRVQGATLNTVTFRPEAYNSSNENNFVGKKINITSGPGGGQVRTIIAYDKETRIATVDSNWDIIPVSEFNRITPTYPGEEVFSIYGIGELETDQYGQVSAVFSIPPETFRVGEKLFRLMNDRNGDLASSSTSGDASYFASGLIQTTEEVMVSTTQPVIYRSTSTEDRVRTNTININDRIIWTAPPPDPGWFDGGGGDGGGDGGGGDPLAQTFFVSPLQYPDGVFIDKVRVCFRTKDESQPVTCQIRPTVNGYPHATMIYPYSVVTLTPDKVNITESPSLDDPTKYTDFVLPAPVYLLPGEHCFVLETNSLKYEAFVCEFGQNDLVTRETISEQPYLGSLFYSQNARTWTAEQAEDMMFIIFKKDFSTNPSIAEFKLRKNILEYDEPVFETNVLYDLIHLITSEITTQNTSITYSFISEKETGGLTNEKPIVPLQNYEMFDGEGRRIIDRNNLENTFALRARMSTRSKDVSPVLDSNRFGFLAIENYINNLPLRQNDFVIENGGDGYESNVSITISPPDFLGVTANGYAEVVSNTVVRIVLDNVGSGYSKSPTITVAAPGSGTTATVTYNGEDKKSGGNAAVRYQTRKVTLADGFDTAGDLRVYLTAYKPLNTNIFVYYKLLSRSDTDLFEDKEWQLMTELGNSNFVSVNRSDFRELTFAPGSNGVPSNNISYTSNEVTYTTFRTFALKVVISGIDSTNPPIIRDFRCIATPAGN